jgi:hypothetical protein
MKSVLFLMPFALASIAFAQDYNYAICKLDPAKFNMQINGYDVNSPQHNLKKVIRALFTEDMMDGTVSTTEIIDGGTIYSVGSDSFTILDRKDAGNAQEVSFRFNIKTDRYAVNGLKVGDGMQEVKDNIPQFCPDRANKRMYTAYGDAVFYIYMDDEMRTVKRMELVDRSE